MMDGKTLLKVLKILEREISGWELPSVSKIAERKKRDPFNVLVGTVLSLRTRDEVTLPASLRLLARAPRPEALSGLSREQIEKLIYPVCFYRNKARALKGIAEHLIKRFRGKVPDKMEDLLSLPGVGRKTANLVMILAHGNKDGLCVDTHVHRVVNRLGALCTKAPDETEFGLREILPKYIWSKVNDILVPFGQKVCTPLSPWCSRCVVSAFCEKSGVGRMR